MLSSLLAGIEQLQQQYASPEPEALITRVASELGPFFGASGVRMVLKPVSEDSPHLLSSIESALAQFLGAQAAADLVTHVVDHAIVRP
jgi:hypothetical protein